MVRRENVSELDLTSQRLGNHKFTPRRRRVFFRPEFFNRIDEVIAFRSLDENDVKKSRADSIGPGACTRWY